MNNPIFVGLGELLWDMLPEGRRLGGAPANFAYHAGALGQCGIVASAVGDDDLGREILSQLRRQSLSTSHISVLPGSATGTVSVELDSLGQPKYVIHENVAWDFIPATDELLRLAGRADAVCFGSLVQRSPVSADTVKKFLAATSQKCLRIFDVNLRPPFILPDVIKYSLSSCDVLKLNEHELPILADMLGLPPRPAEALPAMVKKFGLKLVALTRGADGSALVTPLEISDLPGEPVKVADTVGAGDSFTAAIAVGMLRGLPLEKIHRHAAKLAAYVCTQCGATPPIPAKMLADLK